MEFEFIADRPSLNFVPTLAERGHAELEHLRVPSDLSDWIVQSGLVDNRPTLDDADLARAKKLRDAVFRLVKALIDRTEPATVDRNLVNAIAAQPMPRIELEPDGLHRFGGVDAVLTLLARDCLELHNSPDQHLLRWCADERCTRPYIDRSRGTRRRWCGMRGCGDRAKAAAYRQRRRTEPTHSQHPMHDNGRQD